MALSSAQRSAVRYRLGWPSQFRDYDDSLEQAMNGIASDSDAETIIIALLADCDDIDVSIKSIATGGRTKATRVGNIELRAGYELGTLRSMGRQYTQRIGAILGIEVKRSPYSAGGGAGNYLPHG